MRIRRVPKALKRFREEHGNMTSVMHVGLKIKVKVEKQIPSSTIEVPESPTEEPKTEKPKTEEPKTENDAAPGTGSTDTAPPSTGFEAYPVEPCPDSQIRDTQEFIDTMPWGVNP